MPAHPRTSDQQIVEAAHQLIERDGRDAFSMRDVAALVGIRAPSLYKRFADRAALVDAVELRVWSDLADLLGQALIADDPEASLMAQAKAIRQFAQTHPRIYALFFDIRSLPSEAGTAARSKAVGQLLIPLAALVGQDQAFAAARVIVPYLHGFITMDLADAFRLGDGVDTAFEHGVRMFLRGLTSIDAQSLIDAKG